MPIEHIKRAERHLTLLVIVSFIGMMFAMVTVAILTTRAIAAAQVETEKNRTATRVDLEKNREMIKSVCTAKQPH